MDLHPCASCHRHIDARDAACPFCHVARVVPSTSSSSLRASLGRLSRAAVFAGVAACGGGSTAPHRTTPPPPPPDPVIVQQFATAPPPAEGKASIRGFVTRDGYPLAGVAVHAEDENGNTVNATTGSKGEFTFVDLAPGRWRMSLDPEQYDTYRYSRRPQDGPMMMPDEIVMLDPGENERHDIGVSTPPPPEPDRGPCCKPYGAPPARRRVV
jgi:hypothetical protein